jgi:hypothetical protein
LDAQAIAQCLVDLAHAPELRLRLAERGKERLADAYPGPDRKFAMQLDLMCTVSCTRDTGRCARPDRD